VAAVCCCFPLAAARRKNGGEGGTHEERELALADEAALDVLVRRLELPAAVRVRAHGLDPADPRRRVLLRRRQRVHRRRRRGSGHRRTRCRVHRPLSLSLTLSASPAAALAPRQQLALSARPSLRRKLHPPPPATAAATNMINMLHCKGKSGAPRSRSRRVPRPRSSRRCGADGERAPLVGPRAQSTMALSTGIIKLLLGLGNLAFFVRTTRPRLSPPRRRSMDA
jgi:hypothetical protein